MKKLFDSRNVITGAATVDPDAKIISTRALFIQYKQMLLENNFRQHLETITVSKNVLMMGTLKSPIQKTCEINVGVDTIKTDFLKSDRQLDWLEFLSVYDKSDKHTTIYDSYNFELATKTIKFIRCSNFTEIYSLSNEKKYTTDNLTQEHLFCKQFVAWSCDGSSAAAVTDYMSNLIYQELMDEDDCNKVKSDERVCLDLRASSGYTNEVEKLETNDSKTVASIQLKTAATKKLRLRVWAYSIGEYLYILSKSGLTLRHERYAINQDKEDLLEWEQEQKENLNLQ